MKPKIIFTTLFSFLFSFAFGQSYSITNVLQISPPYSSYIPDYLDPLNFQFSSIITLNDYYEPQHEIKLKISFTGANYQIETTPFATVPAIPLTPGTPVSLSGSDLTPYMHPDNMLFSGISRSAYEQNKSLPEGPCQVCVQAVDYHNPNQVILGNLSCQMIWFSKFDPPIINQPSCGSTVPFSDIQFLSFNWTPLHYDLDVSSPTEYLLQLYEIRPQGMDPNVIVNGSIPFFETTTTDIFYNYSLADPALIEGQWYAWRVQAIDPNGGSSFKNQGYSEVCSFRYGSPEQNILNQTQISLNSEGISARRGSAWWNFDPNINSYHLEYRKIGGTHWFPSNVQSSTLPLKNLEPETAYEVRVRAEVNGQYSDWSNTSIFETDPLPNYACNSTIFPPIPPDFQPLNTLRENDIVQIGQFEMKIKQAEEIGSGHFKGLATIQVPFILLNLRVSFEDILVDQNYVVRQGEILAISEGLENWMQDNEIHNAPVTDIDGVIEDIDVQDSIIIIYLEDDTLTFEFEHEPMVFVDENGMQYAVYSDGQIIPSSAYETSNDHLDASENYQVKFKRYNQQTYGFDKHEYGDLDAYELIRLDDQSIYTVPYKSIGEEEADYVLAQLECDTCDHQYLEFKLLNGQSFDKVNINTNEFKIHLEDLEEDVAIYAYYREDEIGKLSVKVYPEKTKHLRIVNLTNQSLSQTEIHNYIDATFNQANIKWEVEFDEANLGNQIFGSDGLLEVPNTNLMQKYSDEMRSIRNAYFEQHPNVNRNQFFLFVVPGFSDATTNGYMVRGRSVGFIKINSPPHTYAHELGHGLGGLEHTFPDIPEGSTTNLMDYSNENQLQYKQWKQLRNPFVFNWLDDEEDAAFQHTVVSYNFDLVDQNQTHILNAECQTFQTRLGNLIQFSASQQASIIRYHLTNGRIKALTALNPETADYNKYSQCYSANIQSGQIISESMNNYFVCFPCLECEEVQEFGPNTGVCQKKAVTKNGKTRYAYKFIPAKFRINISSENQIDCAPGISVVRGFTGSNPYCNETNQGDCIPEDEGEGGPVNPNSLVKAVELDPSYESVDKNFAWVNIYGKPVHTHSFSDIQCSAHLFSFKDQNTEYIAILEGAVYSMDGAAFFHYVKRNEFEALYQSKIENGDSLRVKDLPEDIFFGEEYFSQVSTNDIVHYRMYHDLGCFMEYEFRHDGRATYELDQTRFKYVQHEAYYGSNCSWELFSNMFCESMDLIGTAAASQVESLIDLGQIPDRIYNPENPNYTSTYKQIFMYNPLDQTTEEEKSLRFAYLCGLFNGVVEELGGIGQIVELMTDLMCKPEVRQALWNLLSSPDRLLDEIQFDGSQYSNIYLREEARGRYTIAVLTVLIPITKANWASKAQNMASTISNLSTRTKQFIIDIKTNVNGKLKFQGLQAQELHYISETNNSTKIGRVSQDGEFILEPNIWSEQIPPNYQLEEFFNNLEYRKNLNSPVETGDIGVYRSGSGEVIISHKTLQLSDAWKPGWDAQRVLNIPKGQRPDPSTYLTQEYIDEHLAKFNSEGGAFIVVKSWIEGGDHTSFPAKKFVMLKSDMDEVIDTYRASGNISDIEISLGYDTDDLAGLENDIYVFYLDQSDWSFNIPYGNEIGANDLWIPGGKTSGGYFEATILNKTDPTSLITHGKNIENLKSQFSWEKL